MRLSCITLLVLAALPLSAETWNYSTIDANGDVGRHVAIATRYGKTHVAYYDATNGNLRYAVTSDDQTWKIETVDAAGDVGQFASIAIDTKGFPHISYYDATNSDLKYATKFWVTWKIETIDSGHAGWYTSIAVTNNDLVYVSYLDMSAWNLEVVKGKFGNWTNQLTDITNVVGIGTSIALNSTGRAQVSYTDNTASSLKYATDCCGSFEVFILDPVNVDHPTAIAVDGSDIVHIAYRSGGLRYMTDVSGLWVSESVDSAIGFDETDLGIALMANGKPAITYFDANFGLKLARKVAEGWTTILLDKGGKYSAPAVGSDGRIRIAYWKSGLRYAIQD